MLKVLIVDDEPLALDVLETYISQMPELQLVKRCSNALEANDVLKSNEIDLMFLDIQMPGLTGLEFMRSLHHKPEVILTTAYREFALEGFDLDVTDYLLKPVSFARFLSAIDKFHKRTGKSTDSRPGILQRTESEATHLFVRADRKHIKIQLADILYLESMKDYVRVVTRQGKVTTKETMMHFESILPKEDFLRVHRSFIVAKDKITAHTPDGLEIGTTLVPVGRMYKMAVEKAVLGR